MKFPDLIHAAKPEPHFAIPQAATAHDTFWDFVSLMPESTHMLMWAMSDRALPRSYRMMQGFGVHTFRLVNAAGQVDVREVPLAAGRRHALARLGRVGEDLRRRSGLSPARSLGGHRGGRLPRVGAELPAVLREAGRELQLRRARRDQARSRGAGAADARSGKMVLNRNPDNFFAETEQVAFCAAHIVPGHRLSATIRCWRGASTRTRHADLAPGRPELSRDPDQRAGRAGAQQPARRHAPPGHQPRARRLRAELAGRRLPVPGRARRASRRSASPSRTTRCAASPSGSPTTTRRRRCSGTARRPIEKAHILRGFRFELTKVQVPAIRERVVAMLANVDADLAETLAARARHGDAGADAQGAEDVRRSRRSSASPALSLFARPGDGSIRTRRIAILVADGVDGEAAHALHDGLAEQGAVPRYVGRAARAPSRPTDGETLEVEVTLETMPSVLFDARRGARAARRPSKTLGNVGHAAGVHQGPVPPRQADPGAGRGRRPGRERRRPRRRCRPAQPDPGMLVAKDATARRSLPDFIEGHRPAPPPRARDGSARGVDRRS